MMQNSSPYASDNASLNGGQAMSNIMAGSGMGYAQPSIGGLMGQAGMGQGQGSYGGTVQPSSLNGYPMFSSQTANVSTPSGYANANPIDATPSVIAQQARMNAPMAAPMNPSQPVAATSNPWNIKSSSSGGSFDYPLGQGVPPPKLNVS